jgi:hypothetical protein
MSTPKIGLVWLIGIILAVAAYSIGPDEFLDRGWALALNAELALRNLQLTLTASSYDLIRAATIGLFVVFLLLGFMAYHRGLRARGALIAVTILFLFLVSDAHASSPRWLFALLLVAIAAASMTRRLTAAPRP